MVTQAKLRDITSTCLLIAHTLYHLTTAVTLTGVRPLQYVEVTMFFYRVFSCDVKVTMLVYLDKGIAAMLCPQLIL